jgi:hypothetical protein
MFWGKVKMFLQTATVIVVLLSIAHFRDVPWANHTRLAFIWTMIISTILSMIGYITKFLSTHRAELFQPANFQPYPLEKPETKVDANPVISDEIKPIDSAPSSTPPQE